MQPFQDHRRPQFECQPTVLVKGKMTTQIVHTDVNWKGCFSAWLTKAVQRSLKAIIQIEFFYLILFLGKQSRIFPPSVIKISFTFHKQPVKFSFGVSASSFVLCFFSSGSSSICLFTTSPKASLQLVPVCK